MKKVLGDPVIKFFISVIGLVVIFAVLKELQHIFIPLVISSFLFFLFQPLNDYLEKYKIPSGVAIFIDLIIMVGLLYGISSIIIESFGRFGQEIFVYEKKLNNLISGTAVSLGLHQTLFTEFDLSEILQGLDYGGIAGSFFNSTITIFSSSFFILFFFIFISIGYENFYIVIKRRYVNKEVDRSMKKIKKEAKKDEAIEEKEIDVDELKEKRSKELENTFKDITTQVQRYIATKFLLSLLTGIVAGVILWLFGVDFFVVWAVFTILLNFIPNIGSTIAVILPGLMTLVQFESFGYALVVTAVLVSIQTAIGNGLEPKVFGDRLGLNPIVILLALLLWGYVWGIVGMFLSVPLASVGQIILSKSNSPTLKFMGELMRNNPSKAES